MSIFKLRVAAIAVLAPRIRQLTLESIDGAPLPAYTPGAHIELHVPQADRQVPLHRAYSLVSPYGDGARFEIAVQLEPEGSGGSRWVHSLQVGDEVTASAPENLFELAADASSFMLFAGGIGITPVLCMARMLSAQGRPFELHYSARDPQCAAYHEEVAAMAGGRCWFDGGDPTRGAPLEQVIGTPRPGCHVYVCGPKPYIAAVLETAARLGWAEAQLHCELFSGVLDEAGDRPFVVELTGSGVTLQVPVGKSVMDVMEEAGLDPMFDCRRGECGICVAKVVEGEADHRDICLSSRERDEGGFCTCVSRARSERLVLEI